MWREETSIKHHKEDRANEKERKRKEQDERARVLAEEIAAKKLKLNEAGEQISDISFAEELPKCVDSSTQTEEFDYLVAGVPPQQPFCEAEFQNNDKKVHFIPDYLHLTR